MILLIEDNPIDTEAVIRAFSSLDPIQEINCFETGDEALIYLHSLLDVEPSDRPKLPRLIILDLSLPGLDGLTVLERIKKSEKLKSIPVVVLSSTVSALKVNKVYESGANTFLRKPLSFETLTEMLHFTGRYWFDVAVIPEPR